MYKEMGWEFLFVYRAWFLYYFAARIKLMSRFIYFIEIYVKLAFVHGFVLKNQSITLTNFNTIAASVHLWKNVKKKQLNRFTLNI